MRVITFLSEKGGCCKTTLTTTLARMLHERGFSVLVIDGDPQAHSTFILRHMKADGLFNLIDRDAAWSDVLLSVEDNDDFWLLPSAQGTAQLTVGTDTEILRDRLEDLGDNAFDFVLVDTAPSISDLHMTFYHASDYVIVPTECEALSIEGMRSTLEHLEAAQIILADEGLACGRLLGIVPAKFNGRESVQHQSYGWLRGKYGEDLIFSPIRHRTAWKQANTIRRGVHQQAPTSKAAQEARLFADQVLSRLGVNYATR